MSNTEKQWDEKWFWGIIELAQRDRTELYTLLANFTKEEIEAFQDHFVELSAELQDEPYTDHMEESEDGIEDIAHWVVSGGRKYYEEVMAKPEKAPHSVEGKNSGNLYGVANEVYFERFQDTLESY